VGLFFSTTLHAQLVQHGKTCNGCTARQIEALLPSCQLGYQYVGDFDSDHLYLGCYREKGIQPTATPYLGIPAQKEYFYAQPSARDQNSFEAFQNVYALNGHSMTQTAQVSVNINLRPVESLGDDGYMNAYDVVGATQNKDAIKNWLYATVFATSNTKPIPFVSPQLAAALTSFLNDIKTGIVSFEYSIAVVLVFHDGSQVTFHYDPHDGTWGYVPGSARDGHGNLIPDSYTAIGGSGGQVYDFTSPYPGYDVYNFDQLLENYGVQPTGSTTTVLECVSVGGDQPSCHYVTVPR
jgi:hypothetical protein